MALTSAPFSADAVAMSRTRLAMTALLSVALCGACTVHERDSGRCVGYKGLRFGSEQSAVRAQLKQSDAFECWDDECGGAYSLMGSHLRIVVPEFEAGRMKSVYVFSNKFAACCSKSSRGEWDYTPIRAEWDYTLDHLTKKFGAAAQVIAEFPTEPPSSDWFVTHRWNLPGKVVELALQRDEDSTFAVAADIRDNHCSNAHN
jgi:hypothetical protein